MRTGFFFKTAIKELLSHKKFALFFILNLALGLSGFIILDVFRESLANTLSSRSKTILGADLEVGARRPLTRAEVRATEEYLKPFAEARVRMIETYTMLASSTSSRLVELKAIEKKFPFYGEIELSENKIVSAQSYEKKLPPFLSDFFTQPQIWAYRETLVQLGLEVGDKVNLGGKEFTVADTLVRDGSGLGAGFSFALPVYVSLQQLERTPLVGGRSTGFYSRLYKLKPEVDETEISKELFKKYKDSAVRVNTHQTSSQQLGRALTQLTDYLGLASLVALFLTSLGTTFLYRTYISQRFRDVAIFKSLGFTSSEVEKIYLFQLLTLGTLAIIPLYALVRLSLPVLEPIIQVALDFDIVLSLPNKTVAIIILASSLGSLLIGYPLIRKTRSIEPKALLQSGTLVSTHTTLKDLAFYLPALLAYTGLALWLTQSFRLSGYFIAGFLVALILILFLGQIFIRGLTHGLKAIPWSRFPNLHLALLQLSRQKFSSLSAFSALAVGLMIMNLIPQVQLALSDEIKTPKGVKIPSLFLFDIQDDQVSTLSNIVKNENVELVYLSPMIRARLDQVNGKTFERADRNDEALTREEENENRFRNRGFNLTYREELSDSESILSGEPFSGQFNPKTQKLPYISLEQRFADRLKLKIGDRLTFDIQGVLIEGEVKNLRRVRWTSFQPNFFVQFQAGVLEDAPKTFLAGLPAMAIDEKLAIEKAIVKELPTISIIEVSKVIERMSSILDQMSVALQAMAFLSVVVGLLILFSIANQQAHERRTSMNLMKVMGATSGQILKIFFIEYSSLALFASITGIALSFGLSSVLTQVLFETLAPIDFRVPILSSLLTWILTLFVIWLAARKVLESKPRELLND